MDYGVSNSIQTVNASKLVYILYSLFHIPYSIFSTLYGLFHISYLTPRWSML